MKYLPEILAGWIGFVAAGLICLPGIAIVNAHHFPKAVNAEILVVHIGWYWSIFFRAITRFFYRKIYDDPP